MNHFIDLPSSKPLSYYLLSPAFLLYSIPRYTLKLLFHKLLILLFGLWINFRLRHTDFSIPLRRLICHDWSKFSLLEFLVYADHFHPPSSSKQNGDSRNINDFHVAFKHHIERQDHHAEHWWAPENFKMPTTPEYRREMSQSSSTKRMVDVAVCEMVVDWHAAEMSYGGRVPLPNRGTWKWPQIMTDSTGLHPVSDVVLHALMVYLGFEKEFGDEDRFAEKVLKSKGMWGGEGETVEKMLRMFGVDEKRFGKYALILRQHV